MSAKDMFKNLGYTERQDTYSLKCVKSYINFKTMSIIYFDYDKTIDIDRQLIDMDLLQAINKQVEELRWNK